MTRFRHWLILATVMTVGVLLLAGDWRDPWLWTYTGTWAAITLLLMFSIDDDLVRERFHPPNAGADAVPLRVVRLVAVGHVAVGALDVGRWHLALVPAWLRGWGLAGMIAFSVLIMLAMRTNRFFSSVVRVQTERGHHVITDGPYARIRHPGYAGMIATIPCGALVLGSWLGFALSLVYAAMIVQRVRFEDAFLQGNLPGYRDYASRVPYRLIPGAW